MSWPRAKTYGEYILLEPSVAVSVNHCILVVVSLTSNKSHSVEDESRLDSTHDDPRNHCYPETSENTELQVPNAVSKLGPKRVSLGRQQHDLSGLRSRMRGKRTS